MLWRITKQANGKTYYFVRMLKNNRIWTPNISQSKSYLSKDEALLVWEGSMNCEGEVVGSNTVEDEIEEAWLTGNGWMI